MTIRLTRDTGVAGALFKLKVKANNTEIGKIAHEEEKTFTLPEKDSVIQIKQLEGKSNKLTVNDGDHIKVTNGPGLLFMFVLAVILAPLFSTFLTGTPRLVSLFFVLLWFFLIPLLMNRYQLEKVDDHKTE
jgi:hypothetical protein